LIASNVHAVRVTEDSTSRRQPHDAPGRWLRLKSETELWVLRTSFLGANLGHEGCPGVTHNICACTTKQSVDRRMNLDATLDRSINVS
jgi:hypothetical protein